MPKKLKKKKQTDITVQSDSDSPRKKKIYAKTEEQTSDDTALADSTHATTRQGRSRSSMFRKKMSERLSKFTSKSSKLFCLKCKKSGAAISSYTDARTRLFKDATLVDLTCPTLASKMTESQECLLSADTGHSNTDDSLHGNNGFHGDTGRYPSRTRSLGGHQPSATKPRDILRSKKDNGAMSRQSTLTRDPFPELSSSPVAPPGGPAGVVASPSTQHILMDTSARSTPNSSPPRSSEHGYRSTPVSRSASGYEIFSGSKSLSVYDLDAAKPLSVAAGLTNDTFTDDSDDQELYEQCPGGEQASWTPSFYTKQLLFFYTDEENYRPLVVDAAMTGAEVCQRLTHKIHARHDVNWGLVEANTRTGMERLIEDHESVHSLHKQWREPDDTRIYFRKDFRKFEPFKNPANFLPEEMVERSQLQDSDVGDLLPVNERYNNVLLEHLFKVDQLPDIHGCCHLKDHKRSWKKVLLILKGTDLYFTSKVTARDHKHLTLVCHLSDVNIYTVNDAKKMYGAPNAHCLCLKPSSSTESKDTVYVSVEDDQSQLCWQTALRLAKYQPQLKENYKLAVSVVEQSALRDQQAAESARQGSVDERVAMDFTGTRGRVVEDPCEAFGVACEEASRWRKKVTGRTVVTGSPGDPEGDCRPSFLTNASVIPSQSTTGLGAGVHMAQPWYHSGISRQEAIQLITRHGLVDGVFLLRESQSIQGIHVLSLAHNHKVKHCQIHKVKCDGQKFYTLDGGATKFTDLIQLVEFYQLNPAGLPCRLSHYVT